MEIKRAGSQPSGKGHSDCFTGTFWIDPLFQTADHALWERVSPSSPARAAHGIRIRSLRLSVTTGRRSLLHS